MTDTIDDWFVPGETIARSKTYPFNIQHPAIPFAPPMPEQTFTLLGGGQAFPLGDAVYFMYSAGRIKIGFSGYVWGRRDGIATGCPFPPVIILVARGPVELERKYHKQFAKSRLHGEWFNVSRSLRNFLKSNLCPIGSESLQKAEADFRDFCLTVTRRRHRATPPEVQS